MIVTKYINKFWRAPFFVLPSGLQASNTTEQKANTKSLFIELIVLKIISTKFKSRKNEKLFVESFCSVNTLFKEQTNRASPKKEI